MMSQDKTLGQTLYFSQWGGERPIPDAFVAAMQRAEERTSGFVPDAEIPQEVCDDPNVVEAFFDTREQRTNEKTLVVIRKANGVIGPLRDFRTTDQGLAVQVESTMYRTADESFVLTEIDPTQKINDKDLGNGWTIREVGVEGTFVDGTFTPGVFPANMFGRERPNLVPEKFRSAIPTVTTRVDSAGTAVDPTLSGDELSERQEQIADGKKRVTVTTQAVPDLPVTLRGQEYVQEIDSILQYDESLDTAGTHIGDPQTEVTPIGGGLEVSKQYDLSGSGIIDTLNNYLLTFPGTANLNLPDELISVSSTIEKSSGDGSYETDSVYGEWTDHGSSSASIRGSGQGSVSIMPFILPVIKEHRADHVPTTHWLFFLPAPVTLSDILTKVSAASSWPKFRPQSATIVAVGRRLSLQVNVDAQAHDAGDESGAHSLSYANGHGTSREIGMSLAATHIPPTIHGLIGISGTTSDSETVTASASVTGSGLMATLSENQSETETIEASVSSSGLYATSGATSVPTTGVYLLDSTCEPYRFGYVRCHAETVDFADV